MAAARLGGVIAAVPTPIDAEGAPDTARFLRHCRWALDNGCDGLNILGTTGEATSFSAERRRTLMAAAAGGLERNRLMVGTGTPDLETTITLTRTAFDLGFAAALVLPPFYYKGVGDDGLFAWFAKVIEATVATPIPVYLYNFPQMTGLTFTPALARRLAERFPERVAGAKDSSGDLAYAAEIAAIDNFDVFPSNEAALARRASEGYAGCISATVNITAPLAARLNARPDDAALAARVSERRAAIAGAGPLIAAVKHLVGRLHADRGFEAVLPPHLPLDEAQKRALDGLDTAA